VRILKEFDKTTTIPTVLLFIIDSVIIFLGLTLLALPFVFRMLPVKLISIHFFGDSYQASLLFFMVSIILFLAIINEVRKILKLMVSKTIFCELTAKYFKRIAYISFALAVVFIYKTFVDFSMPTPLMALTFVFLGIFSYVMNFIFLKSNAEFNKMQSDK
jgi:hypothetical protein